MIQKVIKLVASLLIETQNLFSFMTATDCIFFIKKIIFIVNGSIVYIADIEAFVFIDQFFLLPKLLTRLTNFLFNVVGVLKIMASMSAIILINNLGPFRTLHTSFVDLIPNHLILNKFTVAMTPVLTLIIERNELKLFDTNAFLPS